MTLEDLSPVMRKAYDALPEEERAQFLEEQKALHRQAVRGAIAQVQARNNSHNVGKHVKVRKPKK